MVSQACSLTNELKSSVCLFSFVWVVSGVPKEATQSKKQEPRFKNECFIMMKDDAVGWGANGC